jgi:hypothetical protein
MGVAAVNQDRLRQGRRPVLSGKTLNNVSVEHQEVAIYHGEKSGKPLSTLARGEDNLLLAGFGDRCPLQKTLEAYFSGRLRTGFIEHDKSGVICRFTPR